MHETNDWARKTERQLRIISLVAAVAILVAGASVVKLILSLA